MNKLQLFLVHTFRYPPLKRLHLIFKIQFYLFCDHKKHFWTFIINLAIAIVLFLILNIIFPLLYKQLRLALHMALHDAHKLQLKNKKRGHVGNHVPGHWTHLEQGSLQKPCVGKPNLKKGKKERKESTNSQPRLHSLCKN